MLGFDLDDGRDGRERPWQERLTELINQHGALPRTKATATPSGGRHAFYGWPPDVHIPPGDELFGFTVRWPGRGYLVGPGSSIAGRPYVALPERSIAPLPEAWVAAAVASHGRRRLAAESLIKVGGGFVLPERIPSGRRYATMRDYIASRYSAGLGDDELWALVQAEVAPRFEVTKAVDELRADFERAMAKIAERLGPPQRGRRVEDAIAAVSPIPVLNLGNVAVEAVRWLWHRFLPVGAITLFDGNPGEGKSTIVADLIARLTRGAEWPDGAPVGEPGAVLYVTKEDDPATQVRPRIEAAGGDAGRVMFVAADLLFPRDLPRFRELLEETRPRLVLLDPLMSYLEGKVRAISDNEVRGALMTPLAELAREMGCALLVIRHFNKGIGQSALNRGAGSLGGLAGAARMVLAIATDVESDDDRARVFGVVKTNYEAKPPSLRLLIESAPGGGIRDDSQPRRLAGHL
ncbi:MAG TPA: AAA family ATPase [Candidatus Limnocylindrales bacterium]|nr:AAA family ATPase [Candidatus Limnocylindrales bacterium]